LCLFFLTGFNPALSFGHALDESTRIRDILGRPYGFFLFYNFYEFFLGSGIVVIPLLLTFVARTVGSLKTMENHIVFSYIGFTTIVIVDATGLLHSETTRLWLFLQPLIMIPIGLELMRFNKVHRWIVFSLLWVNVVMIQSNMWFIIP